MVGPGAKRAVVEHFRGQFGVSERRACGLAGQPRSVQRYVSRRADVSGLRARIAQTAQERPRFGYRRIGVLLRRDGHVVNHKRLYRLYSELQLAVRRKRRKRASQAAREAQPAATAVNDCWSLDFLSDALTDGRALRVLAVVDDHSKRSPALECDVAMPAERVIRILDRAIELYGQPKAVRTDNGPEFTSRVFDAWCYQRGIEHRLIRPGKPTENAFAESFNGRVRDELLNQHCFSTVRHSQDLCADWRADYNEIRPHSALRGLSPEQFLAQGGGGHGPRLPETCHPTNDPKPHQANA